MFRMVDYRVILGFGIITERALRYERPLPG